MGKTASERDAIAKEKAKSEHYWNLYGWDSVLDKAFESDWYSGSYLNKWESVWNAEFEDLVIRISKQNLLNS